MDKPLVVTPDVLYDERGFFFESFKDTDFSCTFVQENHSFSKKGVLRGLHQQKGQIKLIRVVHGAVFDVAVDMREGLKTYKTVYTYTLTGENFKQLLIPDGFLHGFYALKDTHLIYKVSQYYNPSLEGGIDPFDRELAIRWPQGEKILSAKDCAWPSLSNLEVKT